MNNKGNLKWTARQVITACLGGLWLVDGILQLQPAMFTRVFVSIVLAPNLQNQPAVIAAIVAFGIRIVSANIFWWNLAAALIQLLISVLLVFPLLKGTARDGDGDRNVAQNPAQRFGLWLSIAWALIVWIFGEGFGGLFTGNATIYSGAPGSALLYLILALFLLYPRTLRPEKLPVVAGVLLLMGAALNLAPMFWQSTMLSMLSLVPPISGWLGTFGSQGTLFGNLLAVDALVCFGIFLLLVRNRTVAWVTIVFLFAVWWIGQNFGGIFTFPVGTATDPNSAPLFMLFLIPLFD